MLFIFTASIFTSGFKWNIALTDGIMINLNLTQIFAFLLFLSLVMVSIVLKKNIPIFYNDRFSLLLYLYVAMNFFSSIAFSSNKTQAIKSAIVVLMYVIIYQTVRWLAAGKADRFINYFKTNNVLSASIGLLAMIVALFSGEGNFGVALGHVNGVAPSIRSLSFEPNIFAIITSTALMFYITASILNIKGRQNDLFVTILLSASILFAYTRSVYISFIVALLIVLWMLKRINLRFALNLTMIIVAVMALIFLAPKNNFLRDAFVSKTTNMFNFEEGNGLERVQIYLIGWNGFTNRPVFGNGTMSADTDVVNATTGEIAQAMGASGWLGGALIQSLHDTGIIGGCIMLALFFSIIYANYKALKSETDDSHKSILLSFLAGNIILVISTQITSTLWISFPYFYWAINMAYLSELNNKLKSEKPWLH